MIWNFQKKLPASNTIRLVLLRFQAVHLTRPDTGSNDQNLLVARFCRWMVRNKLPAWLEPSDKQIVLGSSGNLIYDTITISARSTKRTAWTDRNYPAWRELHGCNSRSKMFACIETDGCNKYTRQHRIASGGLHWTQSELIVCGFLLAQGFISARVEICIRIQFAYLWVRIEGSLW